MKKLPRINRGGRPRIPASQKVAKHYTGIYLSEPLWKRFDRICAATGESYTNHGEKAIERYVADYERKQKK